MATTEAVALAVSTHPDAPPDPAARPLRVEVDPATGRLCLEPGEAIRLTGSDLDPTVSVGIEPTDVWLATTTQPLVGRADLAGWRWDDVPG